MSWWEIFQLNGFHQKMIRVMSDALYQWGTSRTFGCTGAAGSEHRAVLLPELTVLGLGSSKLLEEPLWLTLRYGLKRQRAPKASSVFLHLKCWPWLLAAPSLTGSAQCEAGNQSSEL